MIQFTQKAKDRLLRYHFPGNIRELKSMMDLAAVMCDGKQITDTDISFNSPRADEDLFSKEKTLKEYNVQIIEYFLNKYQRNVVQVANKLDIGKSTIYKMIQDKEIEG